MQKSKDNLGDYYSTGKGNDSKASPKGHKLMGANRVCDSRTKGTKASTKAWWK